MFKGAQGRVSPKALGIRTNSAVQAQCVPLIFGRVQTAPRIIWKSNQQTQTESGKKGKAGKKGSGGLVAYSANFDMLLGSSGFGRVRQDIVDNVEMSSIFTLWTDKDIWSPTFASLTAVVSGGNVTVPVPAGGQLMYVYSLAAQESYSVLIDDYGSSGPVTLTGTYLNYAWNRRFPYYDETSQVSNAGTTRSPNYLQAPAVTAGVTIPVTGIPNGTTVVVSFAYQPSPGFIPLSRILKEGLYFEPFLGDSGISGQPKTYGDVGGVAGANIDEGASAMLPNFKFETVGYGSLNTDGDVSPVDILTTLIMGPHGYNISGFLLQSNGPQTILGDLTAIRNYCRANQIYMSSYYDQQRGTDILSELVDTANSAALWSEGVYKFIPWSEVSAVGDGVTFTAPTASGPVYDIQPYDLLSKDNEPPVKITREVLKDVHNIIPIEYTDRQNNYTVDAVNVSEYESVSDFGPRLDTTTRQFHWLMSKNMATRVGTPIVRRLAIQKRSVISFQLSPRFIDIEPMDLVTLTDPISGLLTYPARITSANVNQDNTVDCEATPFYYGANAPSTLLAGQTSTPGTQVTNVDPGNAGTPIFIEPVPRLYGGGQAQLWIAIPSTSVTYGGCTVHVSVDGGTTYDDIDRLVGKSNTGVIAGGSSQPIANDPDTTNDFDVLTNGSNTTLDSWTLAQADAFIPLIYLSGGGHPIVPYEIEAYTTATLVSANRYTIKATGAGNEVRRSVFGAPSAGVGVAHAAASKFVYLNDPIFKAALDPKWIGMALKFKFTAFNIYGTQEQSVADVSAFSYTPTGVVAQLTGAGGYTITPSQPLSQAAVTYVVAMAQTTATFLLTGQAVNYNARNFSVADPGVGNTQQYWVTVFDPTVLGDLGSGTTLNAYCETNQTKWNTPGYIRIGTIIVTHTGVVTGGGGGTSSGTLQKITVSGTQNGSNKTFTLSTSVTFLMLHINGVFISPNDYTFTGSGFVLGSAIPAPLATDNFDAVGVV